MRNRFLSGAVVLVGSAVAVAACSGTSATGVDDGGSEGGAIDGATNDGGGSDGPGIDAGIVVTEKPAPACNDLTQRAAPVTTTADPGPAPTPAVLSEIALGLYVVTSIIDYGGAAVAQPGPTRTTVLFTATKQYYVHDDEKGVHQVFTLDWKLESGKLTRTILCSGSPGTAPPAYRIRASANGFTVYIDNLAPGSRTETLRYERLP